MNVIAIICFCILKETPTYFLTGKRLLFPSPPSSGYRMTNDQVQTEMISCLSDSIVCISSSPFPAGKIHGWLRRFCADTFWESLHWGLQPEWSNRIWLVHVHCATIPLSRIYCCHFLLHNRRWREKEGWGTNGRDRIRFSGFWGFFSWEFNYLPLHWSVTSSSAVAVHSRANWIFSIKSLIFTPQNIDFFKI